MSGQSIGRFAEEAAWARFKAALQARHDARRGLGRYQVIDNSPWSATGASYVWIRADGAKRLAIYRDGPQPAVGAFLQAVPTSGDPHAPYLALPLPVPAPTGCAGMLYASAQPAGGTSWHIIRCDIAAGYTWQMMGASPVDSAAFPQRAPLRCHDGSRFFTWGSSQDLATPGPLYYSDDHGVSWTACGIDVVNISQIKLGMMLAVGGSNLYRSDDHGATWAAVDAPPGAGTLYDVRLNRPILDNNFALLCDAGVVEGAYTSLVYYPLGGASAPGGAGWVAPHTYFLSNPSGTVYAPGSGGSSTALYALGGDTSPGHHFFADDYPVHVDEEGDVWYATYTATSRYYNHLTDHPDGRTDYPMDWYIVHGVLGVVRPNVDWCSVVALNVGVQGLPTFLINPNFGTGPHQDISARQPADLGAYYVASGDGLTTMELWDYNID